MERPCAVPIIKPWGRKLSIWRAPGQQNIAWCWRRLATEEQSNEIVAIPKLLRQRALAGCMVSSDAMGTQTEIASQIIDQEGDDALALKKNQGTLYHEVKKTCVLVQAEQFAHVQHQYHQTVHKGHSRLEIRR